MSNAYEIVEHDGGAQVAAQEQEIPGHTETIEYEDDKGKWHTEPASA
jgi:hypothetical protein